MADRIPLIVDSSSLQIKELPASNRIYGLLMNPLYLGL
jgi:hypothetical protein